MTLSTYKIIQVFQHPLEGIRAASVTPCLAVIFEEEATTIDTIMDRLRITYRTALKSVSVLEQAGFISVDRKSKGYKGKEKNIYRIKE